MNKNFWEDFVFVFEFLQELSHNVIYFLELVTQVHFVHCYGSSFCSIFLEHYHSFIVVILIDLS